jgi:hypothetical protein
MDPDVVEFHRVFLKGRYGYPQISREQQAAQFQTRKNTYLQEPQQNPVWEIPAIKETKISEAEQLKALQNQFVERNLQVQATKVEERLEEKKTVDTIKSFYCQHTFQTVKAQISLLPIKYKICSKCGLVK